MRSHPSHPPAYAPVIEYCVVLCCVVLHCVILYCFKLFGLFCVLYSKRQRSRGKIDHLEICIDLKYPYHKAQVGLRCSLLLSTVINCYHTLLFLIVVIKIQEEKLEHKWQFFRVLFVWRERASKSQSDARLCAY